MLVGDDGRGGSLDRTQAEYRAGAGRYNSLMLELEEMERRLKNDRLKAALIPPDWHRIEREVPVRRRKAKLTAAFDADLVKWFRGRGTATRRG